MDVETNVVHPAVTAADLEAAKRIFDSVGTTVILEESQMDAQRFFCIPVLIPTFFAFVGTAAEPERPAPAQVKVAAVQMLGYDKTDVPRPGFDPSEAVVQYVERAAKDGAQLVVFPEYLLGRISVPGPQTERISTAAAAGRIYSHSAPPDAS